MPLSILRKYFRKKPKILQLVALIVTERLFTNADKNNWMEEEFHVASNEEQMELSDTESDDLYDNVQEQIKIKVDDFITSPNVCIQWALEYEKPTTALNELRDLASYFKK